jgi:large subunit ribosomal protein L4
VDLPAPLFDGQVHEHLLHQSVRTYLNNQRQGTAKVKSRSEMSGGGKKPWKQKGTGRARAGSNTSPIWRGGGRAFGPEPRDYRIELPKSQRRAALVSALSLAARENRIRVVEDWSMESPKTKQVAELFGRLGVDEGRVLLVLATPDANLVRSGRNLAGVRVTTADQITPYFLLEADQVVLTAGGLQRLVEVFGS